MASILWRIKSEDSKAVYSTFSQSYTHSHTDGGEVNEVSYRGNNWDGRSEFWAGNPLVTGQISIPEFKHFFLSLSLLRL